MRNDNSSLLKLPQVVKSTLIHKGFCTLRCDDLQMDNGQRHSYYTITTQRRSAVVVGRTSEGKLLLTEEYRHAVGQVVLGAAGGFVEEKETPEATARRELLEETGYLSDSLRLLGRAYPVPGLLDQQVYYFLADDVRSIALPKLEPAETLRTVLLTPAELKAAIQNGRSLDSALCTALFFLGQL